MFNIHDLLERAKCGTVVLDLLSAVEAKEVFDELTTVVHEQDVLATIHLENNRIIINPN